MKEEDLKQWFESFENCLDGGPTPKDIIGAGTSDPKTAMDHYRFQHEAKYREAVEDTFPVLLRFLGDSWEKIWQSFWEENSSSPRSLDWVSEVFLNYYQKTASPMAMKELARFEHAMDIHPWRHRLLELRSEFVLTEDSRVFLGNHEILSFEADVTSIYEEAPEFVEKKVYVIIWQKDDGVYYRRLMEWERSVLSKLSLGVEYALEEATDDPVEVGEFFQWLGSSHLIQDVRQE